MPELTDIVSLLFKSEFVEETWILIKIIFPLYLIEVLFTLIYQISDIFAGYLPQKNSELLAAVSLTESIVIFIGHYVFLNITSALYTLASQANGAQENKYLGLLVQRSIWISFLLSIPITIVWLNTENILAIFNQDRNIIELASKYMSVSYAIIPAFILTFSLENLIEMMDVLYPMVVVYILGNVVAAIVGYITCFVLDWGIYAIPIIPISAFYTIAIATFFYCKYSSLFKRIWPGWKWAGFKQWKTYLYYGVPILLTEWGLNIQVYASGFIIGVSAENTTIALSVNAIMISLDMITYALSSSLSIAASVRVGNLIGEGRTELVKQSIITLCSITIVLSLLQAVLLYSTRDVIGRAFTNNNNVIHGVSEVILLLAISHPLDSLFGFIQGVLRGMGRQDYGILITISDMIVSLPVSIILTIGFRMGVWGYWLGLVCGCVVSLVFSVVLFTCCKGKFMDLGRVEMPFVSNEARQLVDNEANEIESASMESSLLINDEFNTSYPNGRIPYCKIFLFITLLLFMILTLGCKFSENKLVIELNRTYLKVPLDFCCIQLKP
ncbi:Multidrug and toxin extrusion protein 1 isoform X1 [Oopsacas minuta]|uniref:Multidrug and toxin extrusion protein n=1 Tax=Oopsacas minuta TaxID=111878 RepID=A0AAV7JC17_9METZ|nr:Multidrug and toxin extrusion protein 1 isoform X1 [Oopsacas minuta]